MESLYEKIGPQNIQKLVNEFYDRVFQSEIIAHLFKNEKEEIIQKQYFFLTQFLGGPQLYNMNYGHPRMRMRHMPHKIDEAAKNEWLRCMKDAVGTLELEEDLGTALYNCFPPVAQHMVNY